MRSVILASLALFSTSAMAGPLAVTASGGASMIGDNPTAMAELDLRPAPILSFATTIQGGADLLVFHESVRLHPFSSPGLDPYVGLAFGAWPDLDRVFASAGLELGLQSQLGEHLVIGGGLQFDILNGEVHDFPYAPMLSAKVGWKF